MADQNQESANQRTLIHDVITPIEVLRRQRIVHRPHAEGKRFTQEERCDRGYSSYKNLLHNFKSSMMPLRINVWLV